jgi:hypothetical protein
VIPRIGTVALKLYAKSWIILLWSALCVSGGAYAMHAADEKAALAAVHSWFAARKPDQS